jgi:hypothetical protein
VARIAESRKKRSFKKFTFRGIDLDKLLDLKPEELLPLVRTHPLADTRCVLFCVVLAVVLEGMDWVRRSIDRSIGSSRRPVLLCMCVCVITGGPAMELIGRPADSPINPQTCSSRPACAGGSPGR